MFLAYSYTPFKLNSYSITYIFDQSLNSLVFGSHSKLVLNRKTKNFNQNLMLRDPVTMMMVSKRITQ